VEAKGCEKILMMFKTDLLRMDETCSHDFHGLGDACEEKYFRGGSYDSYAHIDAPNIACTLKLDDYYDLSCMKSIVIHFSSLYNPLGQRTRLIRLRYAGLAAYCAYMQRERFVMECTSREYIINHRPLSFRLELYWWVEIVEGF